MCYLNNDRFYEYVMHDYMRYFYWKNGRFRVSYVFSLFSFPIYIFHFIICCNELVLISKPQNLID